MTLLNYLTKTGDSNTEPSTLSDAVKLEGTGILLRLLSPIAPHVTHTLWQALGFGDNILNAPWPTFDPDALTASAVDIVIQVNGKVRAKINVDINIDKQNLESMAMAHDNVQKFIADKTVRKVIVVPQKLINIVAN